MALAAVEIGDWQASLQLIERVIGEILARGRASNVLNGNSLEIGVAGYTSGTGPLLGYCARGGLIDAGPEVAEVLAVHLDHNRLRMEAPRRQAIEATILNGMHTADEYFPDPACRPMSDIDLVIALADEPAAGVVLAQLGFEPGLTAPFPPQCAWHKSGQRAEPGSLSFLHAEDPWSIDVQTSLNRRYSSGAPIVRLDDAWRHRESLGGKVVWRARCRNRC